MPHSAKVQREQGQRGDLRRKGLGRSHADFRAGVQVNPAVGFAGDRRADHVADRQRRVPFALAFPHGREGVGRLAALRDREHHRPRAQGRIAIAQLARVFDFGGNAGELFQQIFPNQPGVPTRAARGEHDPVDLPQFLGGEIQTPEDRGSFIVVQPAAHGVFDRSRLLKNLLEHVMLVLAQIDIGRHLIQRLDGRRKLARVAVPKLE